MKANELRIGNLLYWDIHEKKNVIHVVVAIRNNNIMTIPLSLGNSIDDFKPIPLTEEWLLMFGFKKSKNTFDLNKLSIQNPNELFRQGRIYYNSWCIKESVIQYVHQLQNLYFALTGEELTLNNK